MISSSVILFVTAVEWGSNTYPDDSIEPAMGKYPFASETMLMMEGGCGVGHRIHSSRILSPW